MNINELQVKCHEASYAIGWWHHPDTGLPYMPGDKTTDGCRWEQIPETHRLMIEHYWPFVVATKLALIKSEVAEGLEAFRVDANDDKLTNRLGIECELADSVIRTMDVTEAMSRVEKFYGRTSLSIQDATLEKMAFNASRPDHSVVARRKSGGKRF